MVEERPWMLYTHIGPWVITADATYVIVVNPAEHHVPIRPTSHRPVFPASFWQVSRTRGCLYDSGKTFLRLLRPPHVCFSSESLRRIAGISEELFLIYH